MEEKVTVILTKEQLELLRELVKSQHNETERIQKTSSVHSEALKPLIEKLKELEITLVESVHNQDYVQALFNVFTTLIKANNDGLINDTIWSFNCSMETLFEYIANVLNISNTDEYIKAVESILNEVKSNK